MPGLNARYSTKYKVQSTKGNVTYSTWLTRQPGLRVDNGYLNPDLREKGFASSSNKTMEIRGRRQCGLFRWHAPRKVLMQNSVHLRVSKVTTGPPVCCSRLSRFLFSPVFYTPSCLSLLLWKNLADVALATKFSPAFRLFQ